MLEAGVAERRTGGEEPIGLDVAVPGSIVSAYADTWSGASMSVSAIVAAHDASVSPTAP